MFKTNGTSDRVDYAEMLQPPSGFKLSLAVGTTYSLDLETLTSVCLALGLGESADSTLLRNPILVLDALRKVSEKMMVFCDAGQIRQSGTPNSLGLLLEKIIIPVVLPKHKGHYPSFHPKMWLLRYENNEGSYQYRFIVLSRNLTFDRSWDVVFSMDGFETSTIQEKTIPLTHFIEYLRDQAKNTRCVNGTIKRRILRKLIDELQNVSFTTQDRWFEDDFEILPLGIGQYGADMTTDPLMSKKLYSADYTFHELVVVSPFLSDSIIGEWNRPERSLTETTRVLFTRKSELSKLKPIHSDQFRIFTLKDEIVDGESAISDEGLEKQKQDIHAKLYLRRKYTVVDLYLGSMNATDSAIKWNVELLIRLRTKNRYYNSAALLRDMFCGDEDGKLNPFELSSVVPAEKDEQGQKSEDLEHIVKQVCRLKMSAVVKNRDEKYDITLEIKDSLPDADIVITPFLRNNPLPLSNTMVFSQLDILQVSEFYLLRIQGAESAIERIIMIHTDEMPQERDKALVTSKVKDRHSFIEYISFLLADDRLLSAIEIQKLGSKGAAELQHKQLPALYEKMLRSALDDPARFDDIGDLLQMLDNPDTIPAEFKQLYTVFRKTLKKK